MTTRHICQASIAAFLALTAGAQADVFTWDPNNDGGLTAASGTWDLTTPNWFNAIGRLWPNETGVAADTAIFGGTTAGPVTVTLGAPIVANGLTFNTDGYTISDGGVTSNTLTLDGTTPTITVTTAGQTASINATLAGTAGLVKAGAGTLALGAVNTYSGVTSIANGVLSFSASNQLGNAATGNSIAISNNAVLRFTGTTPTDLGTTRSLAIGNGGATIEHSGTALLTMPGLITAAAGNTFTKTGTGTLLLTGNSVGWLGDVVVNAGTLQIGSVAATQYFNAIGASSANRTITINAGGTLDFWGRDATGSAPPAFVINGGTLRNTSGFTRLGVLTLNGGTIDVIKGNSATFQALTFNSDVTVTGNTPSMITTTGGTNNGIHLEKAGGVTFTVADVTGDSAADLSIATPLLNITSTSAANGFIKTGAGTLQLSGNNIFTGTATINDGTVLVTGTNGANAPIAFSTVGGGNPILTTNVAMRIGDVTQSANGVGIINGTGSLALNGNRTFNIGDGAAAVDLFVGVPIVNGDTTGRSLTKTGTGTVQLNAAPTFTGTFAINDGTVILNASNTNTAGGFSMANTAGGTGRLVISDGVTYRLNGNPQTNTAGNGAFIDGPGNLALFGDRAFIIFNNAADDDLVISAPIVNGDTTNRSWRKEQTGRLVVRGDNTYTGATDIYRGELVLDYSVNNGSKLPDTTSATNLRGGILTLSGNASAPTTETVTSFGIPGGAGTVQLTPKNGQALTFNLNAITRGSGQGVVNFTTSDTALGIYQTSTTNNLQGLLGPYARFNTNRFATVTGGILAAADSSVQSDRSQWQETQNIVVDAALSGGLATAAINSLIFDAPIANILTIDNASRALTVRSGGIAVTQNVGANHTTITGGALMVEFNNNTGGGELVLTNSSAGTLSVSASIGSNNAPLSTTQVLTLGGTGLIEISGRNLYSGSTNIHGNVRISGGNAFSDFTGLNLSVGGDMTEAGGALLNLDGSSEGIGSLAGGAFGSQGAGEIQLGTDGTLTINQTGNTTYQGLLTGSGTVIKRGSATLTLNTNAQAFTGEWQVLGGLTDFTNNNPGITGVSSVVLRGGSLLSQQDQGASVDKIANAAVIHLEGTTGNGLRVSSNQNGARTETADRLDINAGSNIITLTNTVGTATAAITTLAFANATDAFTRNNNATLLVRSGVADLGGTSTARSNRVTFASGIAGDLVGNGGAAGSTNISILPFAIGGISDVANPGDSFVTVGANGVRPLSIATEYATGYATAAATDNLSQNATASGLASGTFNSLRIDSSTGAVDLTANAGSTLALTSGAILVSNGTAANTATIGGYDQILAGTADSTPDELVVHVTSSNASAAGATLTINSALANNGAAPTSLTKSGAGTLVLAAASNTYSGATTVNQGILQFSSASQLGADGLVRLAGGTLTWASGNTTDISTKSDNSPRSVELLGPSPYLTPVGGSILTVGNRIDVGSNTVTLANAIGNGGNGALTKAGNGTLTLGASPNYTGPTLVREGTMNFSTIAPNTTSALWLVGDTGAVNSTVTNGLNVQSLIVGGVYSGSGSSTGTLTVNGGAVNIGHGGGDDFILLGFRSSSAATGAGTTMGTADFSAASSVNIDVAQIIMAQTATDPGTVDASLILSNTSNNITANQILIGNSPGPGLSGPTPTITLGEGSNNFAVDRLVIGGQKINGAIVFGPGATSASTFKLRGIGGENSTANLFIGENEAAGTGTTQSSTRTTLDLSGGTADIKANLLVIGLHASGSGNGQGSLSFSAGNIEAQTIHLAMPDARGSSTNDANTMGVITQNGGTLRFGDLSKGNGTATYNWIEGTIGNIAGANSVNQNVTISLLGAGTHAFDVSTGKTATFQTAAGFDGFGPLTKTGAGTLVLNGSSNTFDNVFVEGGTLLANNATGSALGGSPVIVSISGKLGGTGSIQGPVTVNAGGTIAPGASIESLEVGDLTMNLGSTFALEINTSNKTTDLLTSSGSLTLDLATSPALSLADLGANAALPDGTTFTFLTYTGTWNGGLFSVGGNSISDDVESFLFGANRFIIDYDHGGNSVALISVPEPGSATLILGSLAALAGLRRPRRRG